MRAMTRPRLLAAATLLFALALLLHGPIPQWSSYHDFADRRTWFAVPNAADVLSNLPFLLIGAWAWAALQADGKLLVAGRVSANRGDCRWCWWWPASRCACARCLPTQ